MPLKVIRKRVTAQASAALGVASTLAQLANDLATVSQFPLATLAASTLQVIIETIKEVESNKDDCVQLAQRSVRMLSELQNRMQGKDDPPKALLENVQTFEQILFQIRDYMKQMVKVKWMGRFLQKATIESDLKDFNRRLDEAERAFQIASLIEIHYTVSLLHRYTQMTTSPSLTIAASANTTLVESVEPVDKDTVEDVIPRTSSPDRMSSWASADLTISTETQVEKLTSSYDELNLSSPEAMRSTQDEEDFQALRLEQDLEEVRSYGFQRYHKSDVRLRNDMKRAQGFWQGSSVADVGGKKTIVKRYDGERSEALQAWLHDIKSLNNVFHANLPQLIGTSNEDDPNLFIILAHVQLIEINPFLWESIQTESLATCIDFMLRMYRDISSAALYVQRQMNLQDTDAQNWVDDAVYNLDRDKNLVIGLPPARDGRWTTFRSYGLTESIVMRSMKAIPHSSQIDGLIGTSSLDGEKIRAKYEHLKTLLEAFLPDKHEKPELSEEVEDLIVDDEPMSLKSMRSLNLRRGKHTHQWHDNVSAMDIKFSIGDFGYIPKDKLRKSRKFEGFVKLGNIFEGEACALEYVTETEGTQLQRIEGVFPPQWSDTQPFLLPDNIEGWVAALLPDSEIGVNVKRRSRMASANACWSHLLREAPTIAKKHGIEPAEIILVTCSEHHQMYKVIRSGPYWPPNQMHHMHGRPGFGMQHPGGFGQPAMFGQHGGSPFGAPVQVPTMLYLFTSATPGFQPYWSQNPMGAPKGIPRDNRLGMIREAVDWPYSSVGYIQLYAEDFK